MHRIIVDTLTPKQRSQRMALIKSKDTRPELLVRKRLHARGFRYRLHVKKLPGSPDLVFPSRKKVIFIHGCFWHLHGAATCKVGNVPKSRTFFWLEKFAKNRERDARSAKGLVELGWQVKVIWECEILDDLDGVMRGIERFLANS